MINSININISYIQRNNYESISRIMGIHDVSNYQKKLNQKLSVKLVFLSLLYLKMNGYRIFALVDSRDYGCLHNLVYGDKMAVVSFSYHIRILLQQVY